MHRRDDPKVEGKRLSSGTVEKLGEAEREQAWAEIERQLSRLEGPNGVEVPGEFLIGVGTKL